MQKNLVMSKKSSTFAPAFDEKSINRTIVNRTIVNRTIVNDFGAIAQLVEQRTENPCVPGSIPGGTTEKMIADVRKRVRYRSI